MPRHTSHRNPKSKTGQRSGEQWAQVAFELIMFVLIPLLIILASKYLGTNILATTAGVFSIIFLTIVKLSRYKPLFFFSVFLTLVLLMLTIWRWTDLYLIQVITTEPASDSKLFLTGLYDNLILLGLVWMYQFQLGRMRLKIHYEWYASKTFRKFIRMLFYFMLFLALFWLFAWVFHLIFRNSSFDQVNLTISAALLALAIAGTLAVVYLVKPPVSRHSHRSQRRSSRIGSTK